MTLASVMYYTELNPYTLKPIYVPKNPKERTLQKKLFFWYQKNQSINIRQKLLSLQKNKKTKNKYND